MTIKNHTREIYSPESQNLDFIGHLEELRRRILVSLGVLAVASLALFSWGHQLMRLVQRPIAGVIPELIFISPTEVFVSYIKVALLAGFIVSFPVVLYQAWVFLAPAVPSRTRRNIVLWMALAEISFLTGILFAYGVAIPAALKFLLSFGQGVAIARITLAKYISFVIALILTGGIVFEIPVVIGLLTDVGILRSRTLRGQRRYAILVILVAAAVITPTQDIVNMLMFALPMMALFEIGILLSRLIERGKARDKAKDD